MGMLNFAYPAWLFALLGLPLLALVHWQWVERERQAIADFASESALGKMQVRPSSPARLWRGALLILAIGAGLVALSEPRWGHTASEALAAKDGSVVVVIDVSKSMLTQDMGSDSRLKAAQRLLAKLLPSLAGWKVGVVGFAGDAQAMVPLTTDHNAVETLLARVQPGQAPGVGSNIEAGLRTASSLFIHPGHRIVLLLSDGEELSGSARSAYSDLKKAEAEVIAVGLGSLEGGFIPGQTDVWGNPAFVTYRGEKVVSHLVEEPLKRIADDTGGRYLRGLDGGSVEAIARALGRSAEPARPAAAPGSVGYELFQLPLALAFLLVALESAWGLLGRARPQNRFADHVNAWLRRPALGALLVTVWATQSGWTAFPAWLPNSQAGKAFEAREFDKAEQVLSDALKKDDQNFRMRYNHANALYELKRYPEAINEYRKAWEQADPNTRAVIGYNLGNAQFRQAEASQDPKGYRQAIEEYERVLEVRKDDLDARHNLEVAKERLKQSQKAHPPNSGSNGGKSGQGQSGNQGQGANAVGTNTVYKPPMPAKNLPAESEVDALLKALESDERQRQAEQGASEQPSANGTNGGPFAQQLLQQALGTLDMQKDW